MKFRGSYKRDFLVGTILTIIFLLVSDFALVRGNASPAYGWARLSDPLALGGSISHLTAAPSNPGVLYAVQAGPYFAPNTQRLVRSQDSGATWEMLPDENHVFTSLTVDPENPDILYATENNHLWKSTNTGLNWDMLYPFGNNVFTPAPGRIYLTGSYLNSQGHFTEAWARSFDNGMTWEKTDWITSDTFDHLVFSPDNPEIMFAVFIDYCAYPVCGGYSQYSLDGGKTWQMLLVNENPFKITNMAFDPSNPGRIYMVGKSPTASGMWTTENYGKTLSQCGSLPADNTSYLLLVRNGQVYGVPQDSHSAVYIYQSGDQCATWWQSTQSLPSQVNSLIGDPRLPGWLAVATEKSGIFLSTSDGAVWQESNNGLTIPAELSKVEVAPNDPDVILAISTKPRPAIYRSKDGGITWSPYFLKSDPLLILMHPFDPEKAWIGTKDAVYYSNDGVNWSITAQSYSIEGSANDLAVSNAAPNSPIAASGGQYGYIWKYTTYKGQYLWYSSGPILDSKTINTLAMNPRDANDILAGGTNELDYYSPSHALIYRTENGGQQWRQVLTLSYPVIDISINPNSPQIRYVLTGKEGVKRSTDSGETWMDWSGALVWPSIYSGSLAVDDLGGVYVFMPDKIYYRVGDDSDWQIVPLDFQHSFTGALWREDTPYLLSAGSNGLWRKDLPPIHKTWLPALSK